MYAKDMLAITNSTRSKRASHLSRKKRRNNLFNKFIKSAEQGRSFKICSIDELKEFVKLLERLGYTLKPWPNTLDRCTVEWR